MKKQNIIYGVAGMLDYQALIKVGSAKMKISFTNGSSNEAGRTPATFSTDNPIIQLAIENSKEFKSGLISKVHVVKTDEEVYIESDHVALQADVDSSAASGTGKRKSEEAAGVKEPILIQKPSAEGQQGEADDQGKSGETGEAEPGTAKEFTCNDDAKDFLETEFGAKRSTLRSRDAIVACGKSYGVDIKFVD